MQKPAVVAATPAPVQTPFGFDLMTAVVPLPELGRENYTYSTMGSGRYGIDD